MATLTAALSAELFSNIIEQQAVILPHRKILQPLRVGHSFRRIRPPLWPIIAHICRQWHRLEMRTIDLEASAWSSPADFYEALLSQLGSPGWHGYNLNALWDSIASDMNEVKAPFTVIVHEPRRLSDDMRTLLADVSRLFADIRRDRGIEVWFDTHGTTDSMTKQARR